MTIDWNIVFKALASLLSVIITCCIVPWIKAKTSSEERESALELISEAVCAAEQIFTGSGRGEEKKQFVINWLNDRGISIDEDTVNAFIESAVYVMNTTAKELDG